MSFDFGGSSSGGSDGGWEQPRNPPSPPSQPSPGWGSQGPVPDAGTPGPAGSPGTPASAPMLWLGVGLAVAVAGIVLHLLLGGVPGAVAGWVVGGPVAIGLLAVFITRDTRLRGEPLYAESGVADWGRRLLVVLSLVAVGLNASVIADAVARSGR